MTADRADKSLAAYWSAPSGSEAPEGLMVGSPLACIATTYTFDAAFFEVDLLPRFLGVRFDNTERELSFLIEREQALGTVRACVLTDHTCVDAKQTTLRWDQLAVRLPEGAQHAKIVVLAWENCLRIIVSSANLTREGYRRNREMAGVLDIFDHEESLPLKPARSALEFLGAVAASGWVQGHAAAKARMIAVLELIRERVSRWRRAPADFTPRQLPRVSFLGGRPASDGRRLLSILDQVSGLWGDRRANEVTVLTPFVGETKSGMEKLIGRLRDMSRRSEGSTQTWLAIPGHPSGQEGSKRMISDLPASFRDTWNKVWGQIQDGPHICVVPPARKGEKINRILHAKALYLTDDERDFLVCGSSNFTPHGFGIGVANVEANWCFEDQHRGSKGLDERMPVLWEGDDGDLCEDDDLVWPQEVESGAEESPRQPALPRVFQSATFNERTSQLTVYFDPAQALPRNWSIARPGSRPNDPGTILLDSQQIPLIPPEAKITRDLPESLRGANVTCLRVTWLNATAESQSAWLTVQVEHLEDLLPPEQFRGLTSETIMNCLISGREASELVGDEGDVASSSPIAQGVCRDLDPLREIDTSGFTLYQVRKLGQTLTALAERLLRTVRTRDACVYRLRQDPLGPMILADALAKDLSGEEEAEDIRRMRGLQIAFSFAEIALTLAYVYGRIRANSNAGDQDVSPVYRGAISELLARARDRQDAAGKGTALGAYIVSVTDKCRALVGGLE